MVDGRGFDSGYAVGVHLQLQDSVVVGLSRAALAFGARTAAAAALAVLVGCAGPPDDNGPADYKTVRWFVPEDLPPPPRQVFRDMAISIQTRSIPRRESLLPGGTAERAASPGRSLLWLRLADWPTGFASSEATAAGDDSEAGAK